MRLFVLNSKISTAHIRDVFTPTELIISHPHPFIIVVSCAAHSSQAPHLRCSYTPWWRLRSRDEHVLGKNKEGEVLYLIKRAHNTPPSFHEQCKLSQWVIPTPRLHLNLKYSYTYILTLYTVCKNVHQPTRSQTLQWGKRVNNREATINHLVVLHVFTVKNGTLILQCRSNDECIIVVKIVGLLESNGFYLCS